MFNPAYLQISRHGVFYLRWPIPRRFHPANKPTTVRISLRVRDPKTALRLSRAVADRADGLMDAGAAAGMRYDQVRSLLKAHFQTMLRSRIEQINRRGRLSALDKTIYRNSIAIAEDAIAGPYPLSFTESDDTALMARLSETLGVTIAPGTQEYRWFNDELKRGARDYAVSVLKYDESLDSYDFQASPTVVPASDASASSFSMSLADLAHAYESEKKLANQWVPKTASERKDHIALLLEIISKDTDIRAIAAMQAKLVKDTLLRYPKNRSKKASTRGKLLADVLDAPDTDRLHVKTINKYLQTYSDMFEWALRNSHVDRNWFDGLTIRQSKSKLKQVRSSFSSQQIQNIVGAILNMESGLARKDYQKWGPLIAIYTGARLNEISQLLLADVRKIDDIWCFDFNDDHDDKHLKSAASRRRVPVHPQLIAYGLIDYCTSLASAGSTKLFPNFTYDVSNGWGRQLGRWFNETLLPKLGMNGSEFVFHSFRHTVTTNLLQAGVPDEIVKAIVGHAREGVTQQNYFSKGYKTVQLYDALLKLDFSVSPIASAERAL